MIPDLFIRPVETVSAKETAGEAARRMKEKGVGALVLVDANVPTGVVTDRDLALGVLSEDLDPNTTLAGDCASAPVHVLSRSASLLDAVHAMRAHLVRRLPIVDSAGQLIGILTADDLVEHFGAQLRRSAEALQSGFEHETVPLPTGAHHLGRE